MEERNLLEIDRLVELMLTKPEELSREGLAAIRQGIRGPVTLERVAQRITQGLTHPDWRVRERATASFHEIVDSLILPQAANVAQGVVAALMGRMNEEEEFAVYKALLGTLVTFAQAFTRLGNPDMANLILGAFEAQLASLRDRVYLVEVIAALGAVSASRSTRVLVELIKRNELFEVCADALVALGAQSVPALVASLEESQERTQRMRVVDILVRIGPEAERASLEMLKDEQWFVRRNAAFVLTYIGGERSAGPLIQTARDREPRVRAEAVRALGRLGGIEAERAILHALKDEEIPVTEAAAEALGRHGGSEAVEALSTLMEKHGPFGVPSPDALRLAVARSLGRIGVPGCLPALVKGTLDPNPEVKSVCQEAVKVIQEKQKQ